MKCDYCNEEYKAYDLQRRMCAKGRVKYICYRCIALGDSEVKKHKITGMERKGLIGDK